MHLQHQAHTIQENNFHYLYFNLHNYGSYYTEMLNHNDNIYLGLKSNLGTKVCRLIVLILIFILSN